MSVLPDHGFSWQWSTLSAASARNLSSSNSVFLPGCCWCCRQVAAVRQHTGEGREWSLYWTARGQPVPCRWVPVLAAWADLDERESTADIGSRHPILADPEFRIDPVLARFLMRSRFTWLADGTREAYAKDYRLFFSFLWQRGKYWH